MKIYIWLAGIAAYVIPAIVMGIYLVSNGLERPVIGAVLWPLRILKLLLGGG